MFYLFGLRFGKDSQPITPAAAAPPEESETEKSLRESVEERKEAFRGVRAEENRVIAAAYDKAATRMREKRLAELTGDTPAAS